MNSLWGGQEIVKTGQNYTLQNLKNSILEKSLTFEELQQNIWNYKLTIEKVDDYFSFIWLID